MFAVIDSREFIDISSRLDGLICWLTYLDTMSVGKTADFENALSHMSGSVKFCKNALKSVKFVQSLHCELFDNSVGFV